MERRLGEAITSASVMHLTSLHAFLLTYNYDPYLYLVAAVEDSDAVGTAGIGRYHFQSDTNGVCRRS